MFLPSSAPIGNFIWNWAELALLLLFPLTRLDPTWPGQQEMYQNSSVQQNFFSKSCFYLLSYVQISYLKMEDNLNFSEMEDNLNISEHEWQPQIFRK